MYKCMVPQDPIMGQYTAIMTETDRERIMGESDDSRSKRYESASRIRNRIAELEEDANILEEHHPDLYRELREAVCEEA